MSSRAFLTVVSDKIRMECNRSEATRAVVRDTYKILDRVWHGRLLHKLEYNEIACRIFALISTFLNNRWL